MKNEKIIINILKDLLSAIKALRVGKFHSCTIVEGEIFDEKLKTAEKNIQLLVNSNKTGNY